MENDLTRWSVELNKHDPNDRYERSSQLELKIFLTREQAELVKAAVLKVLT